MKDKCEGFPVDCEICGEFDECDICDGDKIPTWVHALFVGFMLGAVSVGGIAFWGLSR